MRVLVATKETQGFSGSDFCWAVDGELVRLPGLTCADPRCGCGHSWAGLASSKATTTCRVADLDIDRDGLVTAFEEAFAREGWASPGDDLAWIGEFVDEQIDLAASFPVGAILENHGDHVRARAILDPSDVG